MTERRFAAEVLLVTSPPAEPAFVFQIELPWIAHLSVNHMYRRGSDNRPKLRSDVKAWREQLAWHARRLGYHRVRELGAQRIRVSWRAWGPDAQRRDTDNLGKVVCDGLKMGLEIDDSRFELGESLPVAVDRRAARVLVCVEVWRKES